MPVSVYGNASFSGSTVVAGASVVVGAAVVLGADGAYAGMKPGAVFVDHTTASALVALELLMPRASGEA
mgnify:CR=1 FL=1